MKQTLFFILFLLCGLTASAQNDYLRLGGVKASMVDSAWVKTNGSYSGKRVADNLYKWGTVGVRTADTTGIINAEWPANSTKPLAYYRYLDASLAGFNFLKLKGVNQTSNPNVGDWNFWVTNFPTNNIPYSTRANNVMRIGYNVGSGGGRILSTDADLHIAFESNYHLGAAIPGLPVGKRVWEWHLQSQDTLGVGHRVITGIGAHDGSAGGIGFNSDFLYLEKYNQPGTAWISAYRQNKAWYFLDSMPVFFARNGEGAGGFLQRNAAGTAYLSLAFADPSNRVVVGGAGVTSVFMPTGKIDVAGLGEIYNTTGGVITIGRTGALSRLDVNAPGSEVFFLKSAAGGSNVWKHVINSNSYVMTKPDGSGFLQVNTDAPVIFMGNNRVGIGTDVRSRLTIQQISNSAQGGLMFVPTSGATEYYQQVNSSSELVFTSGGGQDRVRLSQAGKLTIQTGASSAQQIQGFSNATGESVVYRSDVSPEGSITANPGDVTFTALGLFGKHSGTGNTGWGKFLNLVDPISATTGQILAWNGTAWAPATAAITGIGTFQTSGTANGLSIASNQLRAHVVTQTTPGALSTGNDVKGGTLTNVATDSYNFAARNAGTGLFGYALQKSNGTIIGELTADETPSGNVMLNLGGQQQGGGLDNFVTMDGDTKTVEIFKGLTGTFKTASLEQRRYVNINTAGPLDAAFSIQFINLGTTGTMTIPTTFPDGAVLKLWNLSTAGGVTVTIAAGSGETIRGGSFDFTATDQKAELQKVGTEWVRWQ